MKRLLVEAKGQFNLNTLLITALIVMLESGVRKLKHNNDLITDQATSLAALSVRVDKIEKLVLRPN
jgi:hypothetical protein